jgi:uncharacterized membrane protein YcaP (DUF421 family)
MGKRQIGELEVSKLVSTLLISEIGAIPIGDPDIPLLNAIIPIVFIASLEVLLTALKNKNNKLKRIVEGSPCYVIYKGKVDQKALSDNRISINELISEMRNQGIADINEISYGVLEPNGKLSLIKESDGASYAHPIVIDGEIRKSALKTLGLNDRWLDHRLKERGYKIEELLLLTVNDEGNINIIIKEEKI